MTDEPFITRKRNIHHGAPCIRGTRLSVSVIFGCLEYGATVEEILADYPDLTREDVMELAKMLRERQQTGRHHPR